MRNNSGAPRPMTWSRNAAAAVALALLLLPGDHASLAQEMRMDTASIPQLRKTGHATQLYVGGKPLLLLGGELGNSTASDLDVLEAALAKCERMNLNTVMLPVYWDRIEQEEGKFDFSLVQGAVD